MMSDQTDNRFYREKQDVPKPVAWLHVMHKEELEEPERRLSFDPDPVKTFGVPGKDYSSSFGVTTHALSENYMVAPVGWQRHHPTEGWVSVNEDDIPHYREQGQPIRPLYADASITPHDAYPPAVYIRVEPDGMVEVQSEGLKDRRLQSDDFRAFVPVDYYLYQRQRADYFEEKILATARAQSLPIITSPDA